MFETCNYELVCGDCLDEMKNIPDSSVDFIFTDLPYATTQNKWDCMINLDELWKNYKRIIKREGCIALWAQAPFSHILATSNLKQYRYEWIIEKTKATGHLNAKKMPMKAHENVLIFSDIEDTPETIQVFYEKLQKIHVASHHLYVRYTVYGSPDFHACSPSFCQKRSGAQHDLCIPDGIVRTVFFPDLPAHGWLAHPTRQVHPPQKEERSYPQLRQHERLHQRRTARYL